MLVLLRSEAALVWVIPTWIGYHRQGCLLGPRGMDYLLRARYCWWGLNRHWGSCARQTSQVALSLLLEHQICFALEILRELLWFLFQSLLVHSYLSCDLCLGHFCQLLHQVHFSDWWLLNLIYSCYSDWGHSNFLHLRHQFHLLTQLWIASLICCLLLWLTLLLAHIALDASPELGCFYVSLERIRWR